MADPNNSEVGAVQSCPLTSNQTFNWIEIEMVGEDDKPVAYILYQVTLPTGELVTGFLDGNGFARLDRITQAGTCKIVFPELDQDTWQFIETAGAKGGS